MKKLNKVTLLGLIGLGLTAQSSHGTTFDFSYTFTGSGGIGAGTTVTGSLDGTQVGDFVDGVSDVKVHFNGTAMSGTVFTEAYNGSAWVNGPVVSFTAAHNNFGFINSDLANGNGGFTEYFYMINSAGPTPYAVAYQSVETAYDNPVLAGHWSLTVARANGSAPDGGLTVAMLGIGVSGLAFVRRKP